MIAYEIVEHFAEDPPEPFGTYLHDMRHSSPRPGDEIQLKWLDGRLAYRVRIDRVDGLTLHVTHPGHSAQGTKKTEEAKESSDGE